MGPRRNNRCERTALYEGVGPSRKPKRFAEPRCRRGDAMNHSVHSVEFVGETEDGHLEIPDAVTSEFVSLFKDYDLTPWRAQPHRLEVEEAQLEVMALHFPKILFIY